MEVQWALGTPLNCSSTTKYSRTECALYVTDLIALSYKAKRNTVNNKLYCTVSKKKCTVSNRV